MRWRVALLLVVFVSTHICFGSDDPKESLRAYVDWIEARARESWKENEDWPSDLKGAPQLKLTNNQLIAFLGARLHDDVALDAFIKRQLLDRGPDIAQASFQQVGQMIFAMPALVAQPSTAGLGDGSSREKDSQPFIFIGRQTAFVSDLIPIPGTNSFRPVISTAIEGVGLNASGATIFRAPPSVFQTIRLENGRLQRRRALVIRANSPSLSYREDFINLLPDTSGIHLAARIADTRARVNAGDPTYGFAIKLMVNASERIVSDRSLSVSVRNTLKDDLNALYRLNTTVTRSLNAKQGSNTVTLDQQVVRLDKESYKYVLSALNGRRLRFMPGERRSD